MRSVAWPAPVALLSGPAPARCGRAAAFPAPPAVRPAWSRRPLPSWIIGLTSRAHQRPPALSPQLPAPRQRPRAQLCPSGVGTELPAWSSRGTLVHLLCTVAVLRGAGGGRLERRAGPGGADSGAALTSEGGGCSPSSRQTGKRGVSALRTRSGDGGGVHDRSRTCDRPRARGSGAQPFCLERLPLQSGPLPSLACRGLRVAFVGQGLHGISGYTSLSVSAPQPCCSPGHRLMGRCIREAPGQVRALRASAGPVCFRVPAWVEVWMWNVFELSRTSVFFMLSVPSFVAWSIYLFVHPFVHLSFTIAE